MECKPCVERYLSELLLFSYPEFYSEIPIDPALQQTSQPAAATPPHMCVQVAARLFCEAFLSFVGCTSTIRRMRKLRTIMLHLMDITSNTNPPIQYLHNSNNSNSSSNSNNNHSSLNSSLLLNLLRLLHRLFRGRQPRPLLNRQATLKCSKTFPL